MCVQRAKVEKQKQKEVEIVDKILIEERNLATRKKLQPHLCLDSHKEVVKVFICSMLCHFNLFTF